MQTISSSQGQNSARLRKLLQSVLVVPADLDSFCLDYFPDVYRRFGTSADRDHKLNLLLLLHDAAKIEGCLREFDATRVAHFQTGGASVDGPPSLEVGVRPMWLWLIFECLLLAITIPPSIYLWRLLQPRPGAPNSGKPGVAIEAREVVAFATPLPKLPRSKAVVPLGPLGALTKSERLHPPHQQLPEQLSNEEIDRGLGKVKFTDCPLPAYSDLVMFDLTIEPDGHVSTISTPELGRDYECIRARVKEAVFPKFSGKPISRERYQLRLSNSQSQPG